jgi:hypothetical protein
VKLFDHIWNRVVKIGGFLLGSFIMYHEAITDKSQRPYLYAAALAMMGTQIGEAFSKGFDMMEQFLSFYKTKGKGGGELPPESKSK